MRPLRISILQGAFFPVPAVRGGAVEKLWGGLAIEFARRGHEVVQVSRAVPELPISSMEEGVQHLRVRGYDQPANTLRLKLRDLLYTRRALRALPDADILVTNTFWAPLFARSKKGAIYVSVERMPKGQMKFYRRASRLRACSQAVADGITSQAPSMRDRVRVVPNPLPFLPSSEVDWSLKEKEIVYVGRIHPVKGVELLLQAFLSAKKQGHLDSDWKLTLVGPAEEGTGGGGVDWWKAMLTKHAHEKIEWVGPVFETESLNKIYRRAQVMAYPTLDALGEAMPIAPLEGMAWGCVPVVSGLACFQDYIVPGENGIVFDHQSANPTEALSDALNIAVGKMGVGLSKRAVEVRESHGLSSIADRFVEDFRGVINSSRS
jgi:glycosyltransferase involved in cell wall biosynthesis